MRSRRRNKNRLNRGLTYIVYVAIAVLAVVVLVFGIKTVIPLFSGKNIDSGADEMIKPVGTSATVADIKRKFDEENIIFDTLNESSTSSTIVAVLKDGTTVHFSKTEDVSWQITSLRLILKRLEVDNKKPSAIDFRNGRPIVKF